MTRAEEQSKRALVQRLRDKAFNRSADPILEEAATTIEYLLAECAGLEERVREERCGADL